MLLRLQSAIPLLPSSGGEHRTVDADVTVPVTNSKGATFVLLPSFVSGSEPCHKTGIFEKATSMTLPSVALCHGASLVPSFLLSGSFFIASLFLSPHWTSLVTTIPLAAVTLTVAAAEPTASVTTASAIGAVKDDDSSNNSINAAEDGGSGTTNCPH